MAQLEMHVYHFDCTTSICNHFTNHSIAFSMNGPVECLKRLPCIDVNHLPRVTFLGSQDEWRKVAGKYKHLYKMDTEIAYNWLQVWVNANHRSFKECTIDTSNNVLYKMNHVTDKMVEEAITITDPDIRHFICIR